MTTFEIMFMLIQDIPVLSNAVHTFYAKTGATTGQKIAAVGTVITEGRSFATQASTGGTSATLSTIQPVANAMINEAVAMAESSGAATTVTSTGPVAISPMPV
ncbi:MAG: hypothetical protein HQK96_12905 [Nitrospirae bacterium]|nr:hypothetical protein [Nitrospirota bacterium]